MGHTGKVALKKSSTLIALGNVFAPPLPPVFSAEYQAVLDRATALGYTLPTLRQQVVQNTLMQAIVSSGTFAKSDLIYVFANDGGLDFGRINWKDPATYTLSVNGPVKFMSNYGAYTSTEVAGDKAWLGTGWSPSLGVQFTLNANCIVSRAVSGYGGSGFQFSIGAADRIVTYHLDRTRAMQNNSGTSASIAGVMPAVGTVMNKRTGATASGLYYISAGAVVADFTSIVASTALSAGEVWIAGYGLVDADYPYAALGLGHPLEYCSFGRDLTNAEFIAFDTALTAYVNALRYTECIYASGNYTVPAGVTQLLVECFGAGGAGRGYPSATATNTGGGGAGGAYSASTIAVTPGQIIPVIIGVGGVGGTAAGGAGGDTDWNTGQIIAKGGAGASTTPTTAAVGGQAAAGVGDVKFSGGNGGLGGTVLATGTAAGGSGAGALGNGVVGLSAANVAVSRRPLYNILGPTSPGFSQSNASNVDGIPASFGSGGSGARRTALTKNGGTGGNGYIRVSAPKFY